MTEPDTGASSQPVAESDTADPEALARHGTTVVLVAAGTALLLVLTVAVWQWGRAADLAAQRDAERDAAVAAAAFVEILLGYDHATLDAHAERVTAGATDAFDQTYRRALDTGLASSITELRATATVDVREVFMGPLRGDAIRALVVVDTTVESLVGRRQLRGAYLELDLQLVQGTWLVDSVTSVATLDEILSPQEDPTEP